MRIFNAANQEGAIMCGCNSNASRRGRRKEEVSWGRRVY
jgi:hypothetical protein